MTIGFVFWIVLVFWVGYGMYVHRALVANPLLWAGKFLLFLLIFLLGWQVFGPVSK